MRTKCVGLLLVLSAAANAQPVIQSVLNGASYTEAFAPGSWMALFGSSLAPAPAMASTIPLPKTLGGVSVTVDGKPAALSYVSATQVNALIPFEIETEGFLRVPVVVTSPAGASKEFPIYVNRNAPALFTQNSAGTGRALIFDGAFRPVDQPKQGDVVILYATGLGKTDPPASSDSAAPPTSHVVDDIEIFMGDQQAELLYAGLAPGFVGVYQLNVRVPSVWTDRLYLRQRGWLSNVVRIGRPPQANCDNVVGTIHPAAPTASSPVSYSFPILGATFEVELYVRPGARPFVVAAVAEGGGSFTRVDPANGVAETFATSPTRSSTNGDFSSLLPTQNIMDFTQSCTPFPGNVIPASRNNAGVPNELWYSVPPPDVKFPQYAVGITTPLRVLQSGGRLGMDGGFADYLQIPCGSRKTGKTLFELFVDGKVVASQEVTYQISGR